MCRLGDVGLDGRVNLDYLCAFYVHTNVYVEMCYFFNFFVFVSTEQNDEGLHETKLAIVKLEEEVTAKFAGVQEACAECTTESQNQPTKIGRKSKSREHKKERKILFLIQSGVYVLGSCSIKETQAFFF